MTYPFSTAGLRRTSAPADPRISRRPTSPPDLEQGGGLINPLPASQKTPALPANHRPLLAAVIFSGKTFAAALLALFISFWLALDEPYWAVMAVFIVAQPDSGLVLAKGFYRLCGTAVGLLVTTAMVFALAQYGELFMAALALWIGVCAFAARGRRGFASYAFQLAGYTAAIVGVPAALNPDAAYTVITARATEITLGIVCMGLVSRLCFPERTCAQGHRARRSTVSSRGPLCRTRNGSRDEIGAARLGKGSARQGLRSARDNALVGLFRERRGAPHGSGA